MRKIMLLLACLAPTVVGGLLRNGPRSPPLPAKFASTASAAWRHRRGLASPASWSRSRPTSSTTTRSQAGANGVDSGDTGDSKGEGGMGASANRDRNFLKGIVVEGGARGRLRIWLKKVAASPTWTVIQKAAVVFSLFLLAGAAEIGGGWMVWQACREGKPWWWALAGSAILVAYGFIPTLQPIADFGRLYAAYGGIFIGLSFAWGKVFDGVTPDTGDILGSAVALVGVCIVLFWPRKG